MCPVILALPGLPRAQAESRVWIDLWISDQASLKDSWACEYRHICQALRDVLHRFQVGNLWFASSSQPADSYSSRNRSRHYAGPINPNNSSGRPCERHYSRRVLMADLKRDEDLGSTNLSTAALAHADEPVEQKLVETRNDGRDMNASVDKHINEVPQPSETETQEALFSQDESKQLYAKWDAIQVGFVDEPRQAVERADSLVAGAMKRLAEVFAEERARLEGQWDRGDNVSTEELRLALRRYRAFFGRLLSV
jgi:hypothetical protein